MKNKEKLEKIVMELVKELGESIKSPELKNPDGNTELYGKQGLLDSVDIVHLVIDLEERILEEFNQEISIADEKAMSQKVSPFRNINSLISYLENLLEND